AFSGAKEKIGFDKNPCSFLFSVKVKHISEIQGKSLHEIEKNNALIASFTNDTAFKPKLYPTQQDYEVIKKYQSQNYICIAPSSVWFTKQYPKEKWIDLINHLPVSFTVYLLGASSDEALCNAIAEQANRKNVYSLAGKLSMLQSAALQQNALMNYVNDSAPMHFASAVNAPVTAVYCSTLPSFGYGPLSEKSAIVETKEHLDCRPCGIHGHKECPQKHFKCALTITTGQLLQPTFLSATHNF
ncbi:MAG: glycosyltransferase family 9 protein, partial [Chitinophagaceae bacterium]|nr:glycosyltransferase family 9 protein [Chitinophagaceae bacterium]